MLLPLAVFLLPLVAASSIFKSASKQKKQCLAEDDSKFYNLLSTMTPLDIVHGEVKEIKGCEPEALWMYVRHGTRFPKVHQMEKYRSLTGLRDLILENHAQSRGELCTADLESLKDWSLITDQNQEMLLTSSGVEELRQFGSRLSKNFKELLKKYSPDNIQIRITDKERTRQSAQAIFQGLYKRPIKITDSMIHNQLLKSERNCTAWKLSTKNNKAKEELGKLRSTSEMKTTISDISRRLGFSQDLEYEIIQDIYDVCGYEYAWYHHIDHAPWCAAFTKDNLKVMEFAEDIKYYYKSSHGNSLTNKVGCDLIQDMVDRLSANEPKMTMYVGHSSGIRKILAPLGIGKETEPLSGDGYNTAGDRKWRASYLTPFSANVMAVRYKCKKGLFGIQESRRVAVYVNEKLTPLAACGGKPMCSLSELVNGLEPITNQEFCNKDFCHVEGAKVKDDDDD